MQPGISAKVSPPVAFAAVMALTKAVSLHSTGVWACAIVGATVSATVNPMARAQTPMMDRKVRTARMTLLKRWRGPPHQSVPTNGASAGALAASTREGTHCGARAAPPPAL
ncbi:hypothetical protein GCM10020000_53480 [Streptomyces olivoverticillatus]